MHQNYYFLKQLAPALNKELAGKILIETFSQEKDELILVFAESELNNSLQNPFFIKATLRSNFACLSFPDKFDRARRNSVNLFTGFYNNKVTEVRVFLNERAIEIKFDQNIALVFKLFGNRSNLIAFDANNEVTELFNNKLAADHSLSLATLDRNINQTFDVYLQNNLRHEPLFPTFGKLVNVYLNKLLENITSPEKRWEIIQTILRDLSKSVFYITKVNLVPTLSLLPIGEIMET